MAIDFPNSPTNGQTFTVGTKTWTYSSAENQWLLSSVSPDSGTLTTKGDLLTRSSSALVRLPVGATNGHVLTVDSNETSGMKWASGKVVQIVTGNTSTEATSSTTSYADTNLTATITPTSASNKILVVVTQNGCVKTSGNANNGLNLKLFRGSTEIQRFSNSMGYTASASSSYMSTASTQYLDSPATTSATTYKTQFANDTAAAAVRVQDGSLSNSFIVLYEVTP